MSNPTPGPAPRNLGVEIAANLLEDWHRERREASARENAANRKVSAAVALAIVLLLSVTFVETTLANRLGELQQANTATAIKLDDTASDHQTDATAQAARTFAQAAEANNAVLRQLGRTIAAVDQWMVLDSVTVEAGKNSVRVKGQGASADLGTAYAYTARLAAEAPESRAYLTSVERKPESGPEAVALQFELVQPNLY